MKAQPNETWKAGDVAELDGGFTCIDAGKVIIKADDEGSLYFDCVVGHHYIDAQLDASGEYIGMRKVDTKLAQQQD